MTDPRDIATLNTARSIFRKYEKIFKSLALTPAEKAKLSKMRAEHDAELAQLAKHIGS